MIWFAGDDVPLPMCGQRAAAGAAAHRLLQRLNAVGGDIGRVMAALRTEVD